MGSTETTLYTIAIYTSAVKVKKIRFVLVCALLADFVRNAGFFCILSNYVERFLLTFIYCYVIMIIVILFLNIFIKTNSYFQGFHPKYFQSLIKHKSIFLWYPNVKLTKKTIVINLVEDKFTSFASPNII